MEKLLRKQKKFGRCTSPGHGVNCEVSHEIQSIPQSRFQDNLRCKKEIEGQIEEYNSYDE